MSRTSFVVTIETSDKKAKYQFKMRTSFFSDPKRFGQEMRDIVPWDHIRNLLQDLYVKGHDGACIYCKEKECRCPKDQ